AGTDTVICLPLFPGDTHMLGGPIVAQGGVPPYTYRWFTEPVISGFYPEFFNKYTSDWLSDTAIANPLLLISSEGMKERAFYLGVTDSVGSTAADTVVVGACGESFIPLGNKELYPTVGDTVTFHFFTTFTCTIDSIR